jgi:hypothetical protein
LYALPVLFHYQSTWSQFCIFLLPDILKREVNIYSRFTCMFAAPCMCTAAISGNGF